MGAIPVISLDQWLRFKWAIEAWFSNPTWVLLSAVGLLIVGWQLCPPYWNRWLGRAIVIVVFLYLITFSPVVSFLTVQGLSQPLPPDSGEDADVIVLLGRGFSWVEAQATAAAKLWEAERSPIVFVSGTPFETSRLTHELQSHNLPANRIWGENCSRTTEDNAQFTAAALAPQQIQRLILVTDKPHMLRSMLTFRSLGFEVIPHPVELPSHLSHFHVSKIALREYLALVSYFLLGRFEARSPNQVQWASNSKEAIASCDSADGGHIEN